MIYFEDEAVIGCYNNSEFSLFFTEKDLGLAYKWILAQLRYFNNNFSF